MQENVNETTNINIDVPYATHKEAKIRAAELEMKLWEYVVLAIEEKNKRRH